MDTPTHGVEIRMVAVGLFNVRHPAISTSELWYSVIHFRIFRAQKGNSYKSAERIDLLFSYCKSLCFSCLFASLWASLYATFSRLALKYSSFISSSVYRTTTHLQQHRNDARRIMSFLGLRLSTLLHMMATMTRAFPQMRKSKSMFSVVGQ